MNIHFQEAIREDLPEIVGLLANDPLGKARESADEPLLKSYGRALESIDQDENEHLIIGKHAGEVVACLQLSFLPGLTYKGSWRAQIEGVRVHENFRGKGIGKMIIEHAINEARKRKVVMVQLTSTAIRKEAIHFYEGLGFKATHIGMKLHLNPDHG